MQEISIVAGRAPAVHRPDNGSLVYVTFEGIRESRTVADKLTRIRVGLPIAEAERLGDSLTQLTG